MDALMAATWVAKKGGFSFQFTGPHDGHKCVWTQAGPVTWYVAAAAKKAGTYSLMPMIGGKLMQSFEPLRMSITRGTTYVPHTKVSGLGLFAGTIGKTAHIAWETWDQYMNKNRYGGDGFVFEVSGPVHVECDMTDHQDGSYSAWWRPTRNGEYIVTIQLGDEHLMGSPWVVQVFSAEPAYAPYCELYEINLKQSYFISEKINFKIRTADRYSNPLTRGGVRFDVRVVHTSTIATFPSLGQLTEGCTVTDHLDGTYDCEVEFTHIGTLTIEVLLDGERLRNCPLEASVHHGLTHPPACLASVVSQAGMRLVGIVEIPVEFGIQAMDRFGNKQSVGGDPFQVKVDGSSDVDAEIVDHGDGTYLVKWCTSVKGEYFISVTLNFVHIAGSPFIVHIEEGDCYATRCYAWGPGLQMSMPGETAIFYVRAVDRFGNELHQGGDPFAGVLTGPEEVRVHIEDLDDGTYLCTYRMTKRGQYSLAVKMNGVPIVGSPFSVKVACGAVDVKQCFLFDHLVGTLTAGTRTAFGVETRDLFNNAVGHGGLQWRVDVLCFAPADGGEAENALGESEDHYDGTYELSCTPTTAGNYQVSVTTNGEHLRNSPFPLRVLHSAPYAAHTEVPARFDLLDKSV
jgi:filamin